MNDTKKWDVETCMSGLKDVILDVLVEPKRKREWLGPAEICRRTGIDDLLYATEQKENFKGVFTRVLLVKILDEERVLGEKRGPLRNGEPALSWQLTDEEFQERLTYVKKPDAMSVVWGIILKSSIDGLQDIILDLLVEAKEKEDYTRLRDIRERSGIAEQFPTETPGRIGFFVSALLIDLLNAERVDKHGHGYWSYWTITDAEFQKRSNA